MLGRYSSKILEEELKLKVAKDYFHAFDATRIINKIDFCIAKPYQYQGQVELFEEHEAVAKELSVTQSFLWAESKRGYSHNVVHSFIQLVLTIGRDRTYERELPPSYLGAFDAEKMAFIRYEVVADVFTQNDFNWNVPPSNHTTKEFLQLHDLISKEIERKSTLFYYDTQSKELRKFIADNFKIGNTKQLRIAVTKNNFATVYLKWVEKVKPSISVNWEVANKSGILDADFYLADLLADNNETVKDSLFVLLKSDHYELNKKIDALGFETVSKTGYKDKQKAHREFWNIYERPPKKQFWEYIITRRDLLVPQNVREYKGSFFTPKQWVEMSQLYLSNVLGDDWQDDYYIWDCCAGTGNLLNGLTNKYKIWASTIDQADVDVMKDWIKEGANLLESHVFQFDFLNDSFDEPKLPESLRKILKDPEERKKLVIYINPPYAESASRTTITGTGNNKTDVAVSHNTYKCYFNQQGLALSGRELFAQFTMRIKKEIDGCIIGEFSTLKILQAPVFEGFRHTFNSKLLSLFLMPANTFDNVKGKFPIGFHIWDTKQPSVSWEFDAHVYDHKANRIENKSIKQTQNSSITDWLIATRNRVNEHVIGYLSHKGCDFQNQNYVFFINRKEQLPHPRGTAITDKNLKEVAIYYAVRKCIEATWLNDRDQFAKPIDGWQNDIIFQIDCLVYTLFDNGNNIKSNEGINYWIPYKETDVNSTDAFESHFMTDYFKGKADVDMLNKPLPLDFSEEAQAVLDCGKELWKYYHQQTNAIVNASYYDIREHFQGRNNNGKMNPTSEDALYMELLLKLKRAHKLLGNKIKPNVYKYGFLR